MIKSHWFGLDFRFIFGKEFPPSEIELIHLYTKCPRKSFPPIKQNNSGNMESKSLVLAFLKC